MKRALHSPMRRGLLAACLAAGCTPAAHAAEVQVAVAANLGPAMRAIAAAFERDTGHTTLLAMGSTGKFHAQVRHGAPFHLLLAADDETPARLEQEGLAVPGTRFTYATGRLVLWSARPGLVDGEGKVLLKGGFTRLALADAKLAPYGAAALQVLHRLGLETALQPRLVYGDSVAQAYQFVASGNAELGFVALSQVIVQGRIARGSGWVVPAALHTPLRQDAVLLNAGKDNAAALALLRYLRGETARAILRGHGYQV